MHDCTEFRFLANEKELMSLEMLVILTNIIKYIIINIYCGIIDLFIIDKC